MKKTFEERFHEFKSEFESKTGYQADWKSSNYCYFTVFVKDETCVTTVIFRRKKSAKGVYYDVQIDSKESFENVIQLDSMQEAHKKEMLTARQLGFYTGDALSCLVPNFEMKY